MGSAGGAINPYNGNVYGVIGDAQVELGRYQDAFATFQTMVDMRPGVASYARVSYARELMGDVPGAIQAMEAARDIAGTPADSAWAATSSASSIQPGEPRRRAGAYAAAPRWTRSTSRRRRARQGGVGARTPPEGHRRYTESSHGPVAGIRDRARRPVRRGRPEDQAEQQYALVQSRSGSSARTASTSTSSSRCSTRHTAIRRRVDGRRDEWAKRHSVHVADAYAWALYSDGRYVEASGYARRAMALGYRNALFAFHAGMIQLKLGNGSPARASC